MAKLTVAESNELWEEYCKFMNPNKSYVPSSQKDRNIFSKPIKKQIRKIYSEIGDYWEPEDPLVMETIRQLEDAGSKQLGDW